MFIRHSRWLLYQDKPITGRYRNPSLFETIESRSLPELYGEQRAVREDRRALVCSRTVYAPPPVSEVGVVGGR